MSNSTKIFIHKFRFVYNVTLFRMIFHTKYMFIMDHNIFLCDYKEQISLFKRDRQTGSETADMGDKQRGRQIVS